MFDNGIERTVVTTAVVLWFAHGWYLNERLRSVHDKLDRLFDQFNGLREYLYEIDPQFDDERENRAAFENNESMFAGMNDMELLKKKEETGKRALNTPFVRR